MMRALIDNYNPVKNCLAISENNEGSLYGLP